MDKWEKVWSFETAGGFEVTLEVTPEDMNPADSFEFPEDIEAVRNGDVEWFCAKVAVYGPGGEELGFDILGGCAYKSVNEFIASHRNPDPMNRNCSLMRAKRGSNAVICDYFPSMVREAIGKARRRIHGRRAVYARINH